MLQLEPEHLLQKQQTNVNNNMIGGMSNQLGAYFCVEWCMHQLTDKYIKQ